MDEQQVTPEQKEVMTALRGIELNDKYIYDLENDLRVLDYQRAELQKALDARKAQTKGIQDNYYKTLNRIYSIIPKHE